MTSSSDQAGFTLVEVLVALVLSTLLLLLLGGLWSGVESKSVSLTDRLVWELQARVASIRLERDLRNACAFGANSAGLSSLLLEANVSRVVMLTRPGGQSNAELVAWEVSAGRLMRRRGEADAVGPNQQGGWHFNDHKTMLEPVKAGMSFRFFSGARHLSLPLSQADLVLVDRVELRGARPGQREDAAMVLLCCAGVGR